MKNTKFKVLSLKKQFELAEKAMRNNSEEAKTARWELVLSMTGLIIEKALEYKIYGDQLENIVHECYMVLFELFSPFKPRKGKRGIEARFNPAYKTKPSTYALPWIRHTIQRLAFRESRSIDLPGDLGYQIIRIKEILAREENPSEQRIAQVIKEIGTRSNALKQALKSEQVRSLDKLIGVDSSVTRLDFLRDDRAEEQFKDELKLEVIRKAMREVLNEREIEMIKLKYGLDNNKIYTSREIAAKFNLSRSRIGQITSRSEEKIRHWALAHSEHRLYVSKTSSKRK